MPKIVFTAGTRTVEEIEVEEGTTPQEIMIKAHPETQNFTAPTLCIYEGQPLLRKFWTSVRLRAKDVLIFAELAMGGGGGGGGSNPLAIIGQVVVIALAALATWYIGGAGAFAVGGMFAAGSASAYVAAGVVSGLIMMGGMMAVNALAGALSPPPSVPKAQGLSSQNESVSPTYSIQDRTNKARIYQPEPEGFGKIDVVPDVVAQSWSQYIGNEHYFHAVYGCGRGEYSVKELRFGDTVFWRNGSIVDNAYKNVELQFVPEGGKVTLFPDNVEQSTEVANQELKAPNAGGIRIGPYSCNPPGSTTNRILLSVSLPRGLWKIDPRSGDYLAHSVSYKFMYRQIDDFGNGIGSWATLLDQSYELNTRQAQRFTHDISVAEARYEVYGECTSEALNDGKSGEEIRWEAMVAMLPGTLSYGQSCIAVRIKADNVLSQQAAQQFRVLQVRKLPLWENGVWTAPQETQSFAAALSHAAKSRLGGELTDRQIDLEALWGMEPIFKERGWTFNYWLDGGILMWPLVIEWCSAVMVIPRLVGTMLSFVLEGPNRPVRCDITPYHIVRGTFSPSWSTYTDDTPDDVIIEYIDPDAGYAQRDVRAKLPDSESKKPSRRRVPFVGSRKQAHDIGVYVAACNRWRRIKCTFDLEGMGRNLLVGDVVTVKHPRLRNSHCAAVVDYNAGELRIDAEADIVPPESAPDSQGLYLGFSMPNGSPWGPCKVARIEGASIWLDPADYATVLSQGFDSPFARLRRLRNGGVPTIWTLYTSRAYTRRMLVQSVKATSLYKFTVTCINDDERVYNYKIPVPPWDHRGQLPSPPSVSTPQSLRVGVGGTSESPLLIASWLPVPGAQYYVVEYSVNGTSWSAAGRPLVNAIEIAATPGSAYVRVSAMGSSAQSDWAVWSGNTTLVPPAKPVASLAQPYRGANLVLKWDAVPGSPVYITKVYNNANLVATGSTTDTTWTYDPVSQIACDGPWRSLVARVVSANEAGESAYSEISVTDAPPPTPQNVNVVIDGAASTATITADPMTDDVTGWVALRLRVPNVSGMADILESRVVKTLPVVFYNIDTTAEMYFAIAAKDAFFDVSGEPLELNYWRVTVTPALVEGGV